MPGSSPGARLVLADTSGIYSLLVENDRDHRVALGIHSRLLTERRQLITTNYLLVELHALLLARVGRGRALNILQDLMNGRINILRVGEPEERRVIEILRRFSDKDFSLADATSFAVMERLNVTMALTFDRHFLQFGFQALGLET